MFQVPVMGNIKEYKGKFMLGLDLSQLITGTIIVGYGVASFIFLSPKIGDDLTLLSILLVGILVAPFGWGTIYNMNTRTYIKYFIKYYIMRPRIRCYLPDNIFQKCLEEEIKEIEDKLKDIGRTHSK